MKTATIIIMTLLLSISLATATTLSVISSDYVQLDPELLSSAWSLIIRGNNDAEYIAFSTPQQITGTTNEEKVQAKYGFTLISTINRETCDYALTDTSQRNDIYSYKIEKINNVFGPNIDKEINNCKLKTGYQTYWTIQQAGIVWYDIYCVYNRLEAVAGDVSEGSMNFQAKFTLTRSDGTSLPPQTISSLGITSNQEIPNQITFSESGKNLAIIRWIGGSTYGELCPGQDQYISLQLPNQQWITSNKDRFNEYNQYYSELNSIIKTFESTGRITGDQRTRIEFLTKAINDKIPSVMTPSQISYGTEKATITGAKATLELPRDHLIYLPDFQVLLSTEWLKIIYLSSKPKITDARFTTCAEGSTLNEIQSTIQNVGLTTGKFLISIKCDEGISFATPERSITLAPQDLATVKIPFQISIEQDTKKSCVITATDSINIKNTYSMTFSSDCIATLFCSPEGLTTCVGSTQFLCTNNQWIETNSPDCRNTTCNRDGKCDKDHGETFEICGGKTASDNDCATCNLDGSCDSTETIYSCPKDCGIFPPKDYTTWYIIGGIVTAFAIFILIDQRKIKMKKGKKHRR